MKVKVNLPDLINQVINKYGDQSGVYTKEEEQAMQDLLQLMKEEFPAQFSKWKRFAQKSVLIYIVRVYELDVLHAFDCMKKLFFLATVTYPDLLLPIDPQKIKSLIGKSMFQIVKRAEDEGPAICVFRLKNWDPSTATVEEVGLAGSLYMITLFRHSPEIQRNGCIYVVDIEGFQWAHARIASFDLVMKALRLYLISPQNITKGVLVINSMFLFEKTYNFFKWMLPQQVKSLVNITKKDMTPLSKFVSKDKLPKEFWGTMPDSEAYYDHITNEINDCPIITDLFQQTIDLILKTNKVERKIRK